MAGVGSRLPLVESFLRVGAFLFATIGFLSWAWAYAEQVANQNCVQNCPFYSDAVILGSIENALVLLALAGALLCVGSIVGMIRAHRASRGL